MMKHLKSYYGACMQIMLNLERHMMPLIPEDFLKYMGIQNLNQTQSSANRIGLHRRRDVWIVIKELIGMLDSVNLFMSQMVCKTGWYIITFVLY